MVVSGSSVRRSVLPGWPFCPPVFLPDVSRRLLVRAGFLFSPSLEGGLPLLPLFRPRRCSSSATRAVSAAMTSRCAPICSSNVAMISRSAAASPDGALSSRSEWESGGGNDIESLTHARSRVSSADQRPDTWAVTNYREEALHPSPPPAGDPDWSECQPPVEELPAGEHLVLDIETFSTVDLKRVGLHYYAAHPTTGISVVGFAFGPAGAVQTWLPGQRVP